MDDRGVTGWLHGVKQGLRYFFDLDNPFIPWMLIIYMFLLLVHLAIVYWVYRDALYRYNRGAPPTR